MITAEWWLTAEGSRTINLAGDFLKRGIGFMLDAEALLQRIATGLEKIAAHHEVPDPVNKVTIREDPKHTETLPHADRDHVTFRHGFDEIGMAGDWRQVAPGSWLFLPLQAFDLTLDGKPIHIGGIQVMVQDRVQDAVGDEMNCDDFGRVCGLVGTEGHLSTINIGPGIDVVPYIVPGEEP